MKQTATYNFWLGFLLIVGILFSAECKAQSSKSRSKTKSLTFLSISRSYFHPADLLLFEFYGTGNAYSLSGRKISSKSGLGFGISYFYNARTAYHENLQSIITQSLLVTILYRVAQFRKPFRIDPFLGFGGGIFYFQETTIPTYILRFEDNISDSDKLVIGYLLEFGIPIQFTKHLGIILQLDTEIARLSSKATRFEEAFQIGGIYYGIGFCYYF